MKKSKVKKFLMRKVILILLPVISAAMVILMLCSAAYSGAAVGYFGDINTINDALTEQENKDLIEELKKKVEDANNANTFCGQTVIGKLSDYYGNDQQFKLRYQWILAYLKYYYSAQNNSVSTTVNQVRADIDKALNELAPRFTYKKDKIVTIKEHTEMIKQFKDKYEIEPSITDTVVDTKPLDFKPENYSVNTVIFVKDENKAYEVIEVPNVTKETKEEEHYYLISAKNLKSTYSLDYTSETTTSTQGSDKITITRPVLNSVRQTDKDWDVFKSKLHSLYSAEDSDDAIEALIAVISNIGGDDGGYNTGGGTYTGPVENFSGSEKEFIDKVAPAAIKTYKEYNILPSVTISQAILESGFGKSLLTQKANNLFGIKAFSDWKGPYVAMKTREVNDDGSEVYPVCNFRAYASWDDSVEDHAHILLQRNFAGVRSATNYVDAARALKTGGYATDPEYDSLVISYIRRYGLDKYDQQAK